MRFMNKNAGVSRAVHFASAGWFEGLSAYNRQFNGVTSGIILMIGATVLMALSNVTAKYLTQVYPIGQVLAGRSVVTLFVVAAMIVPFAGLKVFRTSIPLAHIARGVSQCVSQSFTVIALSLMSIAAVTSIAFSAPLWAAVLAMVLLKEAVSLVRWFALFLGLLGVMIICLPGTETSYLGALFALGNAIMYGSVTVAVRSMSKTESVQSLLMWQVSIVALGHFLLLGFGAFPIHFAHFPIFVLCGLANALGQVAWTSALKKADASVVSPFYYLLLIWSAAFGFIVWGDIPTLALISGSAVIIGAAVALLVYEQRYAK